MCTFVSNQNIYKVETSSTINTTNLRSITHFRVLVKLLEKAEEFGYSSEELQAGYNPTSDYIWLWSEWESYTIGIAYYAYHRGEEVQCIYSCPETGEEFFGDTPKDVMSQYEEYINESNNN